MSILESSVTHEVMNEFRIESNGYTQGKAVAEYSGSDRVLLNFLQTEVAAITAREQAKPLVLEVGSSKKPFMNKFAEQADIHYLDIDSQAIASLEAEGKIGICADARTADLGSGTYDIVWSSFLLEHVAGAQEVLDNMVKWTKPGGVCVLRLPDTGSLYGFVSSKLPYSVKKIVLQLLGHPNAGKPGHAPWPTHYDPIVSKAALQRYCIEKGHKIELFYSYAVMKPPYKIHPKVWASIAWIVKKLLWQGVDETIGDFVIAFRPNGYAPAKQDD